MQEILVPVTLILVSWAMKEITKDDESKGLPSELTEEEIAFNFPTVPVAWDNNMEVWDNRFEIFGVLNSYGKVVCLQWSYSFGNHGSQLEGAGSSGKHGGQFVCCSGYLRSSGDNVETWRSTI